MPKISHHVVISLEWPRKPTNSREQGQVGGDICFLPSLNSFSTHTHQSIQAMPPAPPFIQVLHSLTSHSPPSPLTLARPWPWQEQVIGF